MLENIRVALIAHHGQARNFWHRSATLHHDEAMHILELLGLAAEADTVSDYLSHGNQKQLELGIALASDPKELNSPNDVVVKSDGAIYFTDPTYGRAEYYGNPRPLQLDFRGVYRTDPDCGRLAALATDFGQPNGLCFSRDERQLYVNDTQRQQKRADLPVRTLIVLGILGGMYIALGGSLATLVLTDNGLGFGLGRLTAGVAFSLGLILLVIGGGELFTGNNLMVMALVSGKVSARGLWWNWSVAYAANVAGAVLLAFIVPGVLDGGSVRTTAARIAEAKTELGFGPAFLRGVLCNMLVCLAVWLSVSARSVEGKIMAIVFPIAAFVALGFEHCVANFYLIPVGMLSGANVTLVGLLGNILPVTLGNIVGGVGLAIAYWVVYLSDGRATGSQPQAWRPKTTGVLPRIL